MWKYMRKRKKTAKITLSNEKSLANKVNKNTIKIGFEDYKVSLPLFSKTKICMNCAKLGHSQFNCKNKVACINCADPIDMKTVKKKQ